MNGMHDLGGMDGFGPVEPEKDEPVFHAEWEERMYAIASAIPFTIPYTDDHFRFAIEQTPPKTYIKASYYELWQQGVERVLKYRGILENGEIDAYTTEPQRPLHSDALRPQDVEAAIMAGASTRSDDVEIDSGFAVGDIVRVKNRSPYGHTRMPRYVRGCIGEIVLAHGVFVFPDTNSTDDGERPQNCFNVKFTGGELWGETGHPNDDIFIDLFDEYLEPA